ncbi:Rv3235 family protein [Nocardia uniformis]|uniref:Rv3235 family protein n=1 Tax=Nocardia uniformis TaxID=53432 RepID=UPI000833E886|nr:Rv3235 family protein [Nocardia uniformis]
MARNDSERVGTVAPRLPARGAHPEIAPIDVEVCAGARKFAWRTAQVALEVLDGRRPPAQLATIADAAVVAAVRTLVGARLVPGRELGAAVLTRIDVVMVDSTRAEVCGGYDRGPRHFALAAGITRGRRGWRMTVFRVR